MATSSIPAAIDGLLALLRASSELRGVEIVDGEPTTNTPKDFIAVGYAEDGGEVVSGQQAAATIGHLRRSETFDITCFVSAWNGSTSMKSVRDRAFALYAGVENAVRTGGTLGGSVIFADIAQESFAQYQSDQGAIADITFTVSVKINRI